jgi:hypothetical protein
MSATRTEAASSRSRRTPPQSYPAEKARQGEIVLKTRRSRVIFLAGLFGGLVVLAVLAIYLGIVG